MIPTEARAAEENAQKQKTSHASVYRGNRTFMDGRMQAFYTKCPSAPGFIKAPSKYIIFVQYVFEGLSLFWGGHRFTGFWCIWHHHEILACSDIKNCMREAMEIPDKKEDEIVLL